mmetsp:Transcript_44527/g.96879  ORF Transcript_44527/g.96879 Transcript_44527/m.96879 type:complete len:747 (-) Transcript_44527:109-2349(-)
MPAADGQRIKLVPEGQACSVRMPEAISRGLACTDENICGPGPAMSTMDTSTWTDITVNTPVAQNFAVCFCSGPCLEDWHFTEVPGGVLSVSAAEYVFTMDPAVFDPGIPSNYRGSFDLVVDFGGADADAGANLWLKVVPISARTVAHNIARVSWSGRSCGSESAMDFVDDGSDVRGPWHRQPTAGKATYKLTMLANPDPGTYLVCLCVGASDDVGSCTDFNPISGLAADGSSAHHHLEVVAKTDIEVPAGTIYDRQVFTGASGETFMLQVKGNQLDSSFSVARVALIPTGWPCTEATIAAAAALSVDDGRWTTISQWEDASDRKSTVDFEITLSANVGSGAYEVCLMPNGVTASVVGRGTLYITSRPAIGRLYLLEPQKEQSIEVAGKNLDVANDRVMVIDCGGDCGRSLPAATAEMPAPECLTGNLSRASAWHGWAPRTGAAEAAFEVSETESSFIKVPDRFCFGTNIAAVSHVYSAVREAACANRCAERDGDALCDGFFDEGVGRDTDMSTALCATSETCLQLCQDLGDSCYGVEMHRSLNRCYLNAPGVEGAKGCLEQYHLGHLGVDSTWDLHVKENGQFSAPAAVTATAGSSSPELLVFAPVRFSRGGRFKVCFCDRDNLDTPGSAAGIAPQCDDISDYKIQVGLLHVTGVSCLLQEDTFRRSSCTTQHFGGLSCGAAIPAPVVPPAALATHRVPWYTTPEELSFRVNDGGHDSERTAALYEAYSKDIQVPTPDPADAATWR